MGQITQVNPEALNVASQMILKEIDLTGTDADRKAKLDQFEKDWKALTGASDLSGARFVGKSVVPDDGEPLVGVFSFSSSSHWEGMLYASAYTPYKAELTSYGSLTITPLFQHLEAIKIYDDEIDVSDGFAQNLKNIAAYKENLEALGVDTSKPYIIPIGIWFDSAGIFKDSGFLQGPMPIEGRYQGYINNRAIYIDATTGAPSYDIFITGRDIATTLEAVTIKTSNSDADKAANVAAINAYVNNLKSLGVDVTKGATMPFIITGGIAGWLFIDSASTVDVYGIFRNKDFRGAICSVKADGTWIQNEVFQEAFTESLTTTSKQIVGAINEVNAAVKALGAIELKAEDKAANKTALAAFLKVLTDAGIDTSNGYSTPIRITGNSQEYFGTLNIGTGTLLSGVVTDINESHHYPCNVNISDGELTFSETNYFLEKTSNEVTEMLDAIKYSYTPVAFTETTLSNKAQLEVFLSKVPDAQVMHCTYKGVYAGTLHKINGDWFGLLVKNTNDYADNLNVKLQADGTLIEGTTSVQSINEQLDAINGEVK